jgi:ABC-type bacteriocin/lantibiotic exporter with double-glycine peptidase domain
MNAFLFRLLGCRIQTLRQLSDGDVSARLSDLFVAQQLVFGQTLPSLMTALTLLGGLFYLATVGPALLVPLTIAMAVVAILYLLVAPRMRDLTEDRLKARSLWRERLIERFENWRLFRHMDANHRLLSRMDDVLTKTSDLGQRGIVLSSLLSWGTAVASLGFLAGAWWIGVEGFQSGKYTLGQVLVMMGLALAAFRSMVGLASLVSSWIRAEPSIKRLREIVDRSEPESRLSELRGIVRPVGQVLTMNNISFAWNDGPDVLKEFTAEIGPREWVAIVGASGSGKSTLAYLLGGLVEPRTGCFSLGNSGEAVPLEIMRRHVAVVPQEPTVFDQSVRENVLAGLDNVSDEALSRVLDVTDLASFVRRRKRGIDDFVGENGKHVSVGEKIRIALARALVRLPGVIVLDETFGHLDEDTTDRVVRGLRGCDVAAIVLTHDRELARRCDRAYRLVGGVLEAFDETGEDG